MAEREKLPHARERTAAARTAPSEAGSASAVRAPASPAAGRGPLRPEQVLHLQRTIGNRAVQRLLAARGGASAPGLQRMIEVRAPHRILYHRADLDTGGEFAATLAGMDVAHGAAGDRTVRPIAWDQYKRSVVWPNAAWAIPAGELADWARLNLGRGLEPEARAPAPEHRSDDVEQGTVDAVRAQFLSDDVIHVYSDANNVQWGEPDLGTERLLTPRDMREAGQVPGAVVNPAEACVIQALDSLQVNVPGTALHTVAAWHNYFRGLDPPLDYRTDSNYARVYVGILGYRLVNNAVLAWNAIDWNAMGGDGRYLVSSYPNGAPGGAETGHMIGVEVNGGAVTAVHDQQNLTAPNLAGGNVHARYIFKL